MTLKRISLYLIFIVAGIVLVNGIVLLVWHLASDYKLGNKEQTTKQSGFYF